MKNKTEHHLLQEDLQKLVTRLIKLGALEIEVIGDQVYLPYMMNDSVEVYIRLDDSRRMGRLEEDEGGEYDSLSTVHMVLPKTKGDERCGMIIRQPSGNTVSVWYDKAWLVGSCYQYHRIGHSWRRTPGQEDWRRLVNLICVIHDKIEYLGMEYANPLEAQLAPLAEFAPFCYWSPLEEPVMLRYPSSEEGAQAFEWLCSEAEDEALFQKARLYELHRQDMETQLAGSHFYGGFHLSPAAQEEEGGAFGFFRKNRSGGKLHKKIETELEDMAQELLKPEHDKVYRCLVRKLEEASCTWPKRDYGIEENERIIELRREKEKNLLERGYEGQYPVFTKTDPDTGKKTEILLAEEHPFTILEWEDNQFRILEIRRGE